jgi:outer membrane lipopolysaccharide assembly protein LptE/RlpB
VIYLRAVTTRVRLGILALASAALLLSSCGYKLVRYRGAIGDVRRVAIQTLDNDSREPGVDLVVTDALVREFLRRGALDVVEDPNVADLVIGGRVLPLRTAGRSFSSVLLSLEYQVTMTLDLQVRRRDGTLVPVDPTALTETEIYLASADVEAARKNRDEALHRVSTVLAGRVHDALFERLLP